MSEWSPVDYSREQEMPGSIAISIPSSTLSNDVDGYLPFIRGMETLEIQADKPKDNNLSGPLSSSYMAAMVTMDPSSHEVTCPDNLSSKLAARDREILIRKNRKLAQILGEDSSFNPRRSQGQQSFAGLNAEIYLSPLAPSAESSFLANQDPRAVLLPLENELGNEGDEDEEDADSPTEPGKSISLPASPLSESIAERRQKIARLAKLHRHLGSGVPAERVLGITGFMRDRDLPPPSPSTRQRSLYPKRNSSLDSPNWDALENREARMPDPEKAVNVKRASKMEKLFGDRPPQELFLTRTPSPRPLTILTAPERPKSTLQIPKAKSSACNLRPGTAGSEDSTKRLISGESETFQNYRDSINSLCEVAQRDDAESLVSIHRLLNEPRRDDSSANTYDLETGSVRSHTAKSERRRSLPVTRRDSVSSMYSTLTTTTASPAPEVISFQRRRRQVAKLVDFFGVNYKVLFDSVLSTLERGVEEESSRGALRPDETKVLLEKLRSLRNQRAKYI